MKSHQVFACHGVGVREFFHGSAHESHVVRDGVGLLAQSLDLLLLPQLRQGNLVGRWCYPLDPGGCDRLAAQEKPSDAHQIR